jgi:Pyridoxamine 5'-phosphate oxidase
MTDAETDTAGWTRLQEATFARATAATRAAWQSEARMSGDQIGDYLDRHRFGVLATGRPDGRPHAVPVGYVRRGTEVWMPTMGGSVRARNVMSQPWVVLVVSEGDGRTEADPAGWHRMCSLEGTTELVPLADAPGELGEAAPWATHWLRLTPERLYTYDGVG